MLLAELSGLHWGGQGHERRNEDSLQTKKLHHVQGYYCMDSWGKYATFPQLINIKYYMYIRLIPIAKGQSQFLLSVMAFTITCAQMEKNYI